MASAPPVTGADFASTLGDGGSQIVARPILAELAASIPQLAELRRAASSPCIYRFTTAVTTLMSAARVVFAAALLAARQRKASRQGQPLASPADVPLVAAIVKGALMHESILNLWGLRYNDFLEWRWSRLHYHRLRRQFAQLATSAASNTKAA